MHGRGGCLDDELHGHGVGARAQVVGHFGHVFVDDDGDGLGVVAHEDVDEAAYHGPSVEVNEGLGELYSFLDEA